MEYLSEFNFVSTVLRLLLALFAGAAVGYGRSKKHVNAGMRIYMLISIGAALTVLISFYEYDMLYGAWSWAAEYAELKFDGTRFSAQVINGIGFLAAGTIIGVAHQQVSGLTTAIGLFAAACMGIAAGAGFYEGVFISAVMIIIALEVMKPLEVAYKRRIRNITICVEFDSIENVGMIMDAVKEQDAQIFDLEVERTQKEGSKYPSAILTLKLSRENASHSALLSSVAELPCVHSTQELVS